MNVNVGFFKGRVSSFRYALKGLKSLLRSEPNAWVHLMATLFVFAAGWKAGISRTEWMAVCIAVGLVWMAELFNTSLEKAMDIIKPERDPRVAAVKDLAAGAVLIAALLALLIGGVVFIPYLW